MSDDAHRGLRDERLRQRIGPAIKELRDREGWSLRDLGARCGVSSAYLSRIERGASVPSFSILAGIASAFQVSPDYFIQFERAAEEIESSLANVLEELAIPRSIWHEFADLSMEAQSAMVEAVSRVIEPALPTDFSHPDAEIAILTSGVEGSIDLLARAARSSGLSPIDFVRHRTQMEEMEGDRYLMLDRLCTLPASTLFDQLEVFQSTFGVRLEDPMLLKWWIRAQRSALRKSLSGSVSRVIYPLQQVRDYIRSGQWTADVSFDRELAHKHVDATIQLLRNRSNYQVGLLDGPVPLRMIGKERIGVLVIAPVQVNVESGEGERIALRFSDRQVVDRITDYFDGIWNQIPGHLRDNDSVANLLEQELASSKSASTR